MSLFLGKIHYWLYNKIVWFENLEKEIISFAKGKNLPVELWKEEIEKSNGAPTENKPLEEIIDTSNIHGWLQGKIHGAEGRQAAWITRILKENSSYKSDLIEIFKQQGNKGGGSHREKNYPTTPEEMFNALNDYILEGMPCDRVNEVLLNEENNFTWKANMCLHSPHWERVQGDVKNFYELREAWIGAFVTALNDDYYYENLGNRTYSIKKA